jgi:hypothetical protein
VKRWATFDPDRRFRYVLGREWIPEKPACAMVGLNPSIADDQADDPTIRRAIAFCDRWGYGRLLVVNLFALVSTDPKRLVQVPDPVGPENDRFLLGAADEASLVVAVWGAGGELYGRAQAVTELLAKHPLKCLGRTKEGHPRHPLYLRGDTALEDWRRA